MTHSPADTLRAAALRLRALAEEATPGPWRQHDTHLDLGGHTATVFSGTGNDTSLRAWLPTMSHEPWDDRRNVWADASYIAAMHPGVGTALADWLDSAASLVTGYPDLGADHDRGACDDFACDLVGHALAVARAILGVHQ